jgi:hypothetical protein
MATKRKSSGSGDSVGRSDQVLAAAALRKQAAGGKPSREEAAALRRVQRAREAEQRAAAYGAVPKREWAAWSGRQQKVLNEQAVRYGVPIGGATIALPELARWLHDFLAAKARKLAGDEQAEDVDYWKGKRERLRYEVESGQRLDRGEVHQGLGRMAAVLRQAGEALQREFPGAEVVLNQALEDYNCEVARVFGDDRSPDANS